MPSHLPKSFSRPFLKLFHLLEAVLLVAITMATVWTMDMAMATVVAKTIIGDGDVDSNGDLGG